MTASTSPRLDLERAFAIEAVAAASRLCRDVRADLVPSDATAKADRSPVTVADLAAQALVSVMLADAIPSDGLMGEEDAAPLRASPDLASAVLGRVRAYRASASLAEIVDALDRCDDPGGPARRWWTLDPVDGTKGFLRDEQYAVALALVEDGEVVLAVMGSPNLPVAGVPGDAGPKGCLFLAERGRGTRQLALDEVASGVASPDIGASIGVAPIADAGAARYAESVEATHSSQSVSALVADRLGITSEPLRLDSQTKYAVVARGDASIYLRFAHGDYRENVWDHAAGSLIVTEAGGRVTDAFGRALDFTRGRRLDGNRGVVAAASAIHGQVLDAVAAILG
jgi:HAL2 family 3'(2'),5'-bisphosphate nucleotidase